MSGLTDAEPPRRRLNKRQSDTVHRLVVAAVDELRETGYGGLTVRNVAARADVAPATAYTYFSSKGHLVAEVYWRRLKDVETPPADGATELDRVVSVLQGIATVVSGEPALSAACTAALLGEDPEVEFLRLRIGADIRARLAAALEPDQDPTVLSALELLYSGALVHAGMGYISYEDVVDRLGSVARLVLR